LFKELKQQRPEIKALYISGYADEAVSLRFPAGATFLAKPFSPDELISKVRESLERG
jgi:two-component system, cell cycle sensor histidine kinase and response regulator CckA